MDMITKEFIVSKIDASVDGGPYVLITLSDPRDFREGAQSPPGPTVMGVSSMDDLFKGLNKALGSLPRQMTDGFPTTIKIDMREYEDSDMKVGDKVSLQLNKIEKSGN